MTTPVNNNLITLNTLPRDCIGKVFGYFTSTQVAKYKEVCRLWKVVMESKEFLGVAFPKLRYFQSGLSINPRQFVAMANRYQDKLRQLDFSECRDLKDEHLEKVTATFSEVKFASNEKVTENGVVTLLRKMSTCPAVKLSIEERTGVELSQLFSLLRNAPKINKLKLVHNFASSEKNVLIQKEFSQFVMRQGLHSPCSLQLPGQHWVNQAVIAALVDSRIKLKSLDVSQTGCTVKDLQYLIENNCLYSESNVIFRDELQLNNDLVDLLIGKKIKISKLYLQFEHNLSVSHLNNMIHNGLTTRCSLNLTLNNLTPAFVNAIVERQIRITHIYIYLNFTDSNQESLLAFKRLFAEAYFATPFSLELEYNDDGEIPEMFFESLVNQRLKIKGFKATPDLDFFPSNYFIRMSELNQFVNHDFDLEIGYTGENLNAAIQALNRTKCEFLGLKFTRPETESYDITPLIKQLQNCYFLAVDNCSLPTLTELAKTIVRTLEIQFDDVEEDEEIIENASLLSGFIELLQNKENFPHLMILDCNLTDIEVIRQIRGLRPHMQVIHDSFEEE